MLAGKGLAETEEVAVQVQMAPGELVEMAEMVKAITTPGVPVDQVEAERLQVETVETVEMGMGMQTAELVVQAVRARMAGVATAAMVETPVGDVAVLLEITVVPEAMPAPRGILALPNASERE